MFEQALFLPKNLAFVDPPSLKFHNWNDINRHIKDSQVKKKKLLKVVIVVMQCTPVHIY